MILRARPSANIRYILIGAALLLALVLLGVFLTRDQSTDSGGENAKQPRLGLMTTLPLYWGEGDIGEMVQQSAAPSEVYQRLNGKFRVQLVDAIDPKGLQSLHMLLLGQSRALAPKEFDALDRWVRRGGHVMIMADPALQWESEYPLGDKRRPLFTSMLSPLFGHWGVELTLPIGDDAGGADGKIIKKIGEWSVQTVTAGAWQRTGSASAAKDVCAIGHDGLVAECKIGRGSALLIADADLLNPELWQGSGVRAVSGTDDFDNMAFAESNLDRLWSHGAEPKGRN